jgi:hypothetical protein
VSVGEYLVERRVDCNLRQGVPIGLGGLGNIGRNSPHCTDYSVKKIIPQPTRIIQEPWNIEKKIAKRGIQ